VSGLARSLAAALLLAALWCAPAARADHHDSNLPWPSLLPPLPVTTAVQPHPVDNCAQASVACADDLAARLEAQWKALDRTCDHRAVMALSYLRITQAIRNDLARPQPELFRDPAWFTYVTTTFSNRYFKWFDANNEGRPVPEAWRIAYDAMTRRDVTAGQDILLFSNAHVQRDLPFAYEEMGLRAPDGHSHKPDHDAVNEINSRILDPTQDEVSARYDPFFKYIDLKPSPLDELGSMELVKSWREGAWRNAERLLSARTRAQRKLVVDSIESTATAWARLIASEQFPGYRKLRDDYCRSTHP
jgi:uncharacterized protein DUF5995